MLYLFWFFAGAAFVTAGAIYLLLKTPFALFFTDKPDHRKVHRNPTPRLGGVVIVASVLLCTGAALFFNQSGTFFSQAALPVVHAILAAASIIAVVGFFDDTTFVEVRVRHKLLAEFTMAFIAVYICNVNIGALTLFGMLQLPAWAGSALSFLWIIGLANAYNLIDGLDGLAGSVSLIAILTIGGIAAFAGVHAPALITITFILAGSIAGFLFHNLPPAKTFMGDTGSIFLGTMVAILTLYIGRDVIPAKAFVALPLIAAVPILEVFVTMVRRYFKARDKKKPFASSLHSMVIPDNSHIHHRLTYKGYSVAQSVGLIAMLAFTLGCGALLAVLVPLRFSPLLLGYLIVPVHFTLYQLGFGGRFKKALRLSSSRYNGFVKSSLIGVIDAEGSLSERLEQKNVDGVSYIKISESDIPAIHQHLRAAVVRERALHPETTMKKAEEISYLLKGPVFIIEDTTSTELFIREVSKNGSLSISEKTASIQQLLKDFKRLNTLERIRHPYTPNECAQEAPLTVC